MKKFRISSVDIGMPAVLAGAGILTLIICLAVLLPGRKSSHENRALEEAVSHLETRVAELELHLSTAAAVVETGEALEDAPPPFQSELQSMAEQVSDIQQTVDYINKRQGNLEQRVAALSAQPKSQADEPRQAAKKPAKKSRTPNSTARQNTGKAEKYHVVAAGDTRYGIARRYGLSVDQLDRMNGFSADTIIRPGQKILVQK